MNLTSVKMVPAPLLNHILAANIRGDPDSPTSETGFDDRQIHFRIGPEVCVAVIGVGFVGESLLRQFGTVYKSIGYDISEKRVRELRVVFGPFPKVQITTEERDLARATHYLISVPTLLRPDRSINLDYVLAAVRTALTYARPGCTIIIESSVAVGTTRRILGPYRDHFHCGMSPERVDPGRHFPTADKIPKVISALSPASLASITQIYQRCFANLVPVSSPEVAEMTKLYENCYRMVNIAYANEISDACRRHGIDPFEMIEAASTKPYGFEAFHPGLGVGGHCIPINPFYLLSNNKNHLPVLERATRLMWSRPKKLARKFHRRCLSEGDAHRVSIMPRILIVGVGFKPGQAVISCSPGLSFADHLNSSGCSRLAFYDPLVSQAAVQWMEKLDATAWNTKSLDEGFDGIAVCTQQPDIEFGVLKKLTRTFVRYFV